MSTHNCRIDPEWGPGWRLGVLPLTDGSTAVSLVLSHYLVDGLGLVVAVVDAVLGNMRDLGYPPPRSRTRLRAVVQDARQTARDAPEVARALVTVAKLARRRRHDIARSPASRPVALRGGDGDDAVVVPVSRSTSTWMIGMPVRRLLAERVTRWSPGWLRNSGSVWGADVPVTAPSPCNSL